MMYAYKSFLALSDMDENCLSYIDFASGDKATKVEIKETESLKSAIIKGFSDSAKALTQKMCEEKDGLKIINEEIIPALDEVGRGFEEKKVFLPTLLMSAEAAKSAFSVIKEKMSVTENEKPKRGEIILATVKDDIHDIGKNIVKVMLENYGFSVIDLGKDVPAEEIVKTAIEKNIKLVGLSALMTTTVGSMEKTIKLLREKNVDCKVVVGGAVLTEEYADMIGADKYARDAMETVRYAQSIFG